MKQIILFLAICFIASACTEGYTTSYTSRNYSSSGYLTKSTALKKQCEILEDSYYCIKNARNMDNVNTCNSASSSRMKILETQRNPEFNDRVQKENSDLYSEKNKIINRFSRYINNCYSNICAKRVSLDFILDLLNYSGCSSI